jgi:hypothetical protein
MMIKQRYFCDIYFSSLHVLGIHVPIIRRKIAVSVQQWYLSLCMGGVWSADQMPPIQSDKYQCRTDIAIFPLMMGTWMPKTCKEK